MADDMIDRDHDLAPRPETGLELDVVIAQVKPLVASKPTFNTISPLLILHRHLDAAVHMHGDVGREAVVRAPVVQGTDQVGRVDEPAG